MSSVDFKTFKKSLQGLQKDVKQDVIKSTLNQTAAVGQRVAKQNTPVGVYDSDVHFITRDGKEVEFKATAKMGGTLRRGWRTTNINQNTKELYNNVEYGLYVDQGHRKVAKSGTDASGKPVYINVGWVPGKFMLDKATKAMTDSMGQLFSKNLERVKKKYDL